MCPFLGTWALGHDLCCPPVTASQDISAWKLRYHITSSYNHPSWGYPTGTASRQQGPSLPWASPSSCLPGKQAPVLG